MKTESKHTPGKWIAQHRHITVNHPNGEHGYMLAIADFEDIDNEQGVKNCQLCAAAPDMLEALKYCVKYLQSDPQKRDGGSWELTKAQAAITQATGYEQAKTTQRRIWIYCRKNI
jgi:hypothetical protein